MARSSWVVGDVHGCFRTLESLLARIELDADVDRLWLVGDLVNRGPRSLEVLRWARAASERMGERFAVVLGNHDLHLLAVAAGMREARPKDALSAVLGAADSEELLAFLARLPFAVRDGDDLLVHAGLLPDWTAEEALRRADRLARDMDHPASRAELLGAWAGGGDGSGGGSGEASARDLAVLTGVRALDSDRGLCSFSGPLADLPPGCTPWFEWPDRASAGSRVFFGHWAALGLHLGTGTVGLDTGCSWGQELTAFRREDGTVVSQRVIDEL